MGKAGNQKDISKYPDRYFIYTDYNNNYILDIRERNKPDLAGNFSGRIHSLGNDAGLLFQGEEG